MAHIAVPSVPTANDLRSTACRVTRKASFFHAPAIFPGVFSTQISDKLAVDGDRDGHVVVRVVVMVEKDRVNDSIFTVIGAPAAYFFHRVLVMRLADYLEQEGARATEVHVLLFLAHREHAPRRLSACVTVTYW